MKRLDLLGGLVFVVAGIWAPTLWADGFRNPPDTAAALGKAGNDIVWVDDASAVFYNPANLVDVPSREVQISALVGYIHGDYSGALGDTKSDSPWAGLPVFALAWPLKETDFALGFGVHVPFGRQTRWDDDGLFPVSAQLAVVDASPAMSWRISDSVSIGAGLDLYYGRLQYRQLHILSHGDRFEVDADGYAVGGNAGITWRMTPSQRFALTYSAPFDLRFRGEMETEHIPGAADSSDLETTFKFPTIVALGYGIQLTETVCIETKVEWLEFSRFKTMDIDAGANAPLASAVGLAHASQNWDDTWTFGIGPEWRFARDWTLRVGYLYLQSPVPDSTLTPIWMDSDQSVATAGLGYQRGNHAVDVAYALGIFDKRNIKDNQQPYYNGRYEFEGHLAALTYSYAF